LRQGSSSIFKARADCEGWGWVGSHLELWVFDEGRGAEEEGCGDGDAEQELKVGFANLYTRLGDRLLVRRMEYGRSVIGNQRLSAICQRRREGVLA